VGERRGEGGPVLEHSGRERRPNHEGQAEGGPEVRPADGLSLRLRVFAHQPIITGAKRMIKPGRALRAIPLMINWTGREI